MKLLAIAQRSRRRDFVDLHAILATGRTLDDLLDLFVAKYPKGSVPHLLRSLVYFDEAEQDDSPRMIKRITWAQVKRDVRAAVAASRKHGGRG